MVESLPTMVDTHIKEQVKKQVPEQVRDQVPVYVAEGLILERQKTKEEMERMIAKAILQELDVSMKFESLQVPQTTCRSCVVRPRDQDDPHDDAHPEGENRAKRQKTSEYEAYVYGESSSGQVNENEKDDDEIPTKQMSQDIIEEVSLTINEAKLKKMVDEMLRQRCTSGDEHQYHIDQMKNFLKSDIVWESRKEILVSPHPRKTTPLVQSCQGDPEAPPLSLINQDLFYQQKVNLTAPTISFPGVEKHKMFSIIYEPVHGIIYKNSKKEKRVMRHSEIHKFCDATLNRVLEGLRSYNNDVKYGYIQRDLTNEEVEYLKLFEEEIEVRLKYRNQMRRWEMYVNGRPLGPRRERPE
ncbi:hypothetical protein Tco_0155880 [Tanacetum coccineum]